mmetsp:Transcript_23904/g.68739  ORF Transcript_23904/g.68739 Transcript_23904/m.68739 type:complete len:317 (-) Transcript_23904:1698-2648(-)
MNVKAGLCRTSEKVEREFDSLERHLRRSYAIQARRSTLQSLFGMLVDALEFEHNTHLAEDAVSGEMASAGTASLHTATTRTTSTDGDPTSRSRFNLLEAAKSTLPIAVGAQLAPGAFVSRVAEQAEDRGQTPQERRPTNADFSRRVVRILELISMHHEALEELETDVLGGNKSEPPASTRPGKSNDAKSIWQKLQRLIRQRRRLESPATEKPANPGEFRSYTRLPGAGYVALLYQRAGLLPALPEPTAWTTLDLVKIKSLQSESGGAVDRVSGEIVPTLANTFYVRSEGFEAFHHAKSVERGIWATQSNPYDRRTD